MGDRNNVLEHLSPIHVDFMSSIINILATQVFNLFFLLFLIRGSSSHSQCLSKSTAQSTLCQTSSTTSGFIHSSCQCINLKSRHLFLPKTSVN